MTQPPANLLLQIEQLLNSGKLQEARLMLVDFIQGNPNSARAWWLLSMTLADVDRQVACLKRVLRLDPENKLAKQRLTRLSSQLPAPASVSPFTSSIMGTTEELTDDMSLIPDWARPVKTSAEDQPSQPPSKEVGTLELTPASNGSQESSTEAPANPEPEATIAVQPDTGEYPETRVVPTLLDQPEISSPTSPEPSEPESSTLVSPALAEDVETSSAIPAPVEPEISAPIPVEPVEAGEPVEPLAVAPLLLEVVEPEALQTPPSSPGEPEVSSIPGVVPADQPMEEAVSVVPSLAVTSEPILTEQVPVSKPVEMTGETPVMVESSGIETGSTHAGGTDMPLEKESVPVEAEAVALQPAEVSVSDESVAPFPNPVEQQEIEAEPVSTSGPEEHAGTEPPPAELEQVATKPVPAVEPDAPFTTLPVPPVQEALTPKPVPVSAPAESLKKPSIPVEPKTASTKRALFHELDKSFNAPPAPVEAAVTSSLPPMPVEVKASTVAPVSSAKKRVAAPPRPPAPVKPTMAAPRSRNSNSKWEIVYILIAAFAILATVAVIGYIAIQHRGQAQSQAMGTMQNLQQTLVIAQTLTSLPLPTLIPTWTLSPTWTGVPTTTHTSTPIPSPTLEPTASRTPRPPNQVGPVVGLYAPDFNLVELASGKQVTLSQYDGQPVMIFFWATWCIHCNNEIGSIETIFQTNKPAGLVSLTVNAAEDLATVTLFRSNHNLTVPILLDPDSVFKTAYTVNTDTIPLHFFIDSSGRIKSIQMGEMTQAELQTQVDIILQPVPTSTP